MSNREVAEETFTNIIRDYVRDNKDTIEIMYLVDSSKEYIEVLELQEDLKDYPNLTESLENLIQKDIRYTLIEQKEFLLGIKKDLETLSEITTETIDYFIHTTVR